MILYRIQKEKYTHLIPSAARSDMIKELEERIIGFINTLPNKVQVLVDFYKVKSQCLQMSVSLVVDSLPTYNDDDYYNCKDHKYKNFLSVLNIYIFLFKNTSFAKKMKIKPVEFSKLWLGHQYGTWREIFELCADIFFPSIMPLVTTFQHMNYITNDYFPTMMLDFTENPSIFEVFDFVKNEPAKIYSMNFCEENLTLIKDENSSGFNKEIVSYRKGFALNAVRYEENHITGIHNWKTGEINGKFLFKEENNPFMTAQKGVCVYWPWYYSVEELKNNEFGERIEFKEYPAS
ncbi:hypothetical protein FACS1894140_1920 [Spirochaetia bacterium]|nr:hypothetical protein FACS1894140_1920 [Spirochaetia bacterium]